MSRLADDLSTHPSGEEVTAAGINSILPKEDGRQFYELKILHTLDKDVCSIASWDSSIHDSQYLNKITERKQTLFFQYFASKRFCLKETDKIYI